MGAAVLDFRLSWWAQSAARAGCRDGVRHGGVGWVKGRPALGLSICVGLLCVTLARAQVAKRGNTLTHRGREGCRQ